mgnify:CR=1 FL=1
MGCQGFAEFVFFHQRYGGHAAGLLEGVAFYEDGLTKNANGDYLLYSQRERAKKAIAKFLNEYTFQKNGPLKLHFREEVGQDGAAQKVKKEEPLIEMSEEDQKQQDKD